MTSTAVSIPAGALDESGSAVVRLPVPHDDVTAEHDCKVGGCPRPAKSNRGKHAYLCDVHIAERRASGVDEQRPDRRLQRALEDAAGIDPDENDARGAQGRRSPARTAPGDRTLAEAVKALQRPAQRLEKATASRRAARAEAQAAVAEFNEALRAVREIASALLA